MAARQGTISLFAHVERKVGKRERARAQRCCQTTSATAQPRRRHDVKTNTKPVAHRILFIVSAVQAVPQTARLDYRFSLSRAALFSCRRHEASRIVGDEERLHKHTPIEYHYSTECVRWHANCDCANVGAVSFFFFFCMATATQSTGHDCHVSRHVGDVANWVISGATKTTNDPTTTTTTTSLTTVRIA